jgi:hypothetical protein
MAPQVGFGTAGAERQRGAALPERRPGETGSAQPGLARRTGRFRQLVDPRSRVSGLLLIGSPRFREVSLEERRSLVGPTDNVVPAVSGVTLYRVKGRVIDEGQFIALK